MYCPTRLLFAIRAIVYRQIFVLEQFSKNNNSKQKTAIAKHLEKLEKQKQLEAKRKLCENPSSFRVHCTLVCPESSAKVHLLTTQS